MMKLTKLSPFYLLAFLLLLVSVDSVAQTKYVMSGTPMFKVDGGSSLHDWSMTSQTGVGEGSFVMADGKLKTVRALTVNFVAETLKSGTKGLDTNAYKALNTSKNKEIRFDLKEFSSSGTSYLAKGDLTIAGVTKAVSFPVKLTTSGSKLTFEGSFDTKLTTFSVTPPTALLGTVKTHDNIKISFKSTFQPIL
ncbi:MAG: hypothetical protein C0433_07440 [Cyclobacterium sp.]|nr:hypothetical protein [Cyclobacterium sp.]